MEVQVRLLTQLPSNGLYEGFVVLPNGTLLVARADAAELYQVDLNANGGDDACRLLHRFQEAPDISSIINICDIPGVADEFIVLVGLFDLRAVRVSNYQIWRFSMSSSGSATNWKRVTTLDHTGFFLSVVAISDRVLLVTDSARHRVDSVDLVSGDTEVLATHESFRPATDADFFGINRLCVDAKGTVWFTNSSRNLLGRFRVEPQGTDTTTGARLVGDVEIVAEGFPDSDGLAVVPDGSAAFLVTMDDGRLLRVDLTGGPGNPVTDVEVDLVNPTAVGLISPWPKSKDGCVQVCVICNGQFDVGWKNHDPSSGWRDVADIVNQVKVTVTVTEE
ncbi:hypothetical protein PG993_005621 [Apiospora rasikravindrae]|uniref:SMP-30/Gluconolactonase/LRE-like region domain-containing protein n=1 Tax=Apiospora rasikravindrae TaxID=990691 RepID=A0ABR1TG72_9PEZI